MNADFQALRTDISTSDPASEKYEGIMDFKSKKRLWYWCRSK